MADKLTREDRSLKPSIRPERSLAHIQALPWLIVIVLLAAVAWLGWRAFFYHAEGDPVASAMLAFEKQNSLNVFSSRFEVVAESTHTTSLGPIDLNTVRQASIVPATVTYMLDMSHVGRDSFTWDGSKETLDVVLPPLHISPPNIDEANARYFTDGKWVTGGAQRELSRNNSQQAARKAAEFAKTPQILSLARQAAKDAVRQNLAIPLQVAGYGDVKVNVRFTGENIQTTGG